MTFKTSTRITTIKNSKLTRDLSLQIARHRGIPCHVLILSCEEEQHISRVQSPDRVLGDQSKLAQPGEFHIGLAMERVTC